MKATDFESEFNNLIQTENDYLSLIIKCHYHIDKMLDMALSESLPQSNSIEFKRVSLLLKVDFLTAMGDIKPQTRIIFEMANTIRNKFAHDPYSEFEIKDSKKSKNLLCSHSPSLVPESFKQENIDQNILKTLFTVCFLQALIAYENTCRQKVSNSIAYQLAQEAISPNRRASWETISVKDDFNSRCERMLHELYPGISPI
ncbi:MULTISPECIES: hypothetical protein [unclassified Pseudomonas]|uniref:hypothetical protein n=1 Tax=unclassified Pseudomonas TaxID=196821 RepID=UPI0011A4CC18|nr:MULTISPECIES: hypothetical protein [unclassified Pseudomonas]TWC27600.1 hypothetical protein FBY05_101463 [Pseudomonas sp. SJZ083]TWC54060.1 hypothetical protein FBY01_101253 [Pseudomonas sp. SJZ077]